MPPAKKRRLAKPQKEWLWRLTSSFARDSKVPNSPVLTAPVYLATSMPYFSALSFGSKLFSRTIWEIVLVIATSLSCTDLHTLYHVAFCATWPWFSACTPPNNLRHSVTVHGASIFCIRRGSGISRFHSDFSAASTVARGLRSDQ